MKIQFNGQTASYEFKDVIIKNSTAFNFLCAKNAKENVLAEIVRMQKEIELLKGFRKLQKNYGAVISIVRNSHDSNIALKEIVKEFNVTKEQAYEFLEMELDEVSKIDFDLTINGLVVFLQFYEKFYDEHFKKD